LGLGPPTDGGNMYRAVATPTAVTALGRIAVRQIACGDAASFAVASDGRLALWGTLPLPAGGTYPVQEHLLGGAAACKGDNCVLWPSFLRRQPPGYSTLPALGSATSALLMLMTVPSSTPMAEDQENAGENSRQHQGEGGDECWHCRVGCCKRKRVDSSDDGRLLLGPAAKK
jgi:hypothetical protein